MRKARTLELERLAPQPIVQGRHLLTLALKPGPAFKPIIDAAFEAQLHGAFVDETGGLAWVQDFLRKS